MSTCIFDIDCSTDGYYVCDHDLTCVHKNLFPMFQLEFWGYSAVFWCLWFTNMGGMGGGGMLVPIAIFFFGFDAKNAIAISNFSIFLSSA